MGINSPKKIWVGVIGGWMSGVFEVKCASSLKGLCGLMGANYLTAKDKLGGGDGPVTLYSGKGWDKRAWSVVRVDVVKVVGRGGMGGKIGDRRAEMR